MPVRSRAPRNHENKRSVLIECGNEAAAVRPEFHGSSFAAARQGASGAQIFKAVAHARLLTGAQKP